MDRFVIPTGTSRPSIVAVGPDLVDRIGELLDDRPGRATVAVASQPTTVRIAGAVAERLRAAGLGTVHVPFPDGEAAKTIEVLGDAYRALNQAGLTRDDTVVAVGGGALTDAAGFVAATYLRGIEAVYVPTTLLAAVDAAIGGKTAINVDGKNLAGAFAHPTAVVVDESILAALPVDEAAQGHAEALKAGYVGDPELVAMYRAASAAVDVGAVVRRAVGVKVEIVRRDFEERGPRAHLNLGHTVGHAVEAATGLRHGSAVAIGMVAAAAASKHVTGFDWIDDVRGILEGLGLPVAAPHVARDRLVALMALDKKRTAAGLRMVLLEDVGVPVVVDVGDATVRTALDAIGVRP